MNNSIIIVDLLSFKVFLPSVFGFFFYWLFELLFFLIDMRNDAFGGKKPEQKCVPVSLSVASNRETSWNVSYSSVKFFGRVQLLILSLAAETKKKNNKNPQLKEFDQLFRIQRC